MGAGDGHVLQVLVATALTVLIGVALGVGGGEQDRLARPRPVNDVLQTLPQLVYIIPFIYLMPISYVPGIVAGVLYAFPVVVRLVERGVRDVAPETVEAASAYGATRRQVLTKVKIPLASDAIMLGVNQGIIMVLAVVVIGGLVGSEVSATSSRRGSSGASSDWVSWRPSRSWRSGSRSIESRRRHDPRERRVSGEEEIGRQGGGVRCPRV